MKSKKGGKEFEPLALEGKEGEKTPKTKKKKKSRSSKLDKKGVMLLSHIPTGFFEPQMYRFFSQFGEVTRLKLARSRKTGKTRHFAFIEFQYEEVARVAVETMNNYLMYQKILKCKLLPEDQVKPTTFKNWQRKYQVPKRRRSAIITHNTDLVDPIKIEKKRKKVKLRREKLQKKLNDSGIEYDIFSIKINESFVAPARSRATPEDIKILRTKPEETDERCSDFDYEDEEMNDLEEGDKEQEKDVKKSTSVPEKDVADAQKSDSERENEDETEKSINLGPKEPKADDFDVMVVDLDDSEVTFKSPPASAKIKRSVKLTSTNGTNQISEVEPNQSKEQDNTAIKSAEDSTKSTPRQTRLQKLKLMQKALEATEEPQNIDASDIEPLTPKKKKVKKTPKTEKKVSKTKKKMNQTM